MNENTQVLAEKSVGIRFRIADYVSLLKPELTSLSVLTALCGFYLASVEFDVFGFFGVGLGTLLLGGGAGALNQYIERDFDRLMRRTERRPIPSGRLRPHIARNYGILLSILGLGVLFAFTSILAGLVGLLTLTSYLFWYTPLKRVSPHATLVGALPGALPPLIGWTAATGEVSLGGWILFLVLFFWQMPHFLSLAWLYRKDYARAGYKMLTVEDSNGRRTSMHIILHTSLLLVVSLLMTPAGYAGAMYAAGAAILGLSFLAFSIVFWRFCVRPHVSSARTNQYSRYLFFASLLYLPALMFLMTVDKL